MKDPFDSKKMHDALAAIREKLERMRLERTDSMERLVATREAAEDARTDRLSPPPS